MAQTQSGIVYPVAGDSGDLATHFSNMATSLEYKHAAAGNISTGAADHNKYSKIATIDLNAQYQSKAARFSVVAQGATAGNHGVMECYISTKQQAAMGSAPEPLVRSARYVDGVSTMYCWVVEVERSVTRTRYEVYIGASVTYTTLNVFTDPVDLGNSSSITWHMNSPWLTSLPAGVSSALKLAHRTETDANNMLRHGDWELLSPYTNGPTAQPYSIQVGGNNEHDGLYRSQIATCIGESGKVFTRSRVNGTWGGWQKFSMAVGTQQAFSWGDATYSAAVGGAGGWYNTPGSVQTANVVHGGLYVMSIQVQLNIQTGGNGRWSMWIDGTLVNQGGAQNGGGGYGMTWPLTPTAYYKHAGSDGTVQLSTAFAVGGTVNILGNGWSSPYTYWTRIG